MRLDALHDIYPRLYGTLYSEREMDKRFKSLVDRHRELFGKENPMLFSAGGRMEVIGNHTDHNQGLVIGASINLDTIAAVSRRDDMRVILSSEGFRKVDIDLSETSMRESERESSSALVRGIADFIKRKGYPIGGFEANTTTRVLRGSGLSSSAAIEVLVGEIFNSLYANGELTPLDISIAGKSAENNYYGKPSGLLDQIACSYGDMVEIDFKTPDAPKVKRISGDLIKESGYKIIITDTKGNHADLTDEYSSIPKEMKEVASYFGKESLREVSYSEFLESIHEIREQLNNDRAILRAMHFFEENIRVKECVKALSDKDIDSFLGIINSSGESSYKLLQNVYPSSRTETQGISIALALSKKILKNRGAVRVHGGGFAGTILAFVPEDMVKRYIKGMDNVFGKGSSNEIQIRHERVTRIL